MRCLEKTIFRVYGDPNRDGPHVCYDKSAAIHLAERMSKRDDVNTEDVQVVKTTVVWRPE